MFPKEEYFQKVAYLEQFKDRFCFLFLVYVCPQFHFQKKRNGRKCNTFYVTYIFCPIVVLETDRIVRIYELYITMFVESL